MADDLRRSRVLTFFRLPISIPHIVWFILWTILAVVAAVLNWLCALVIGRAPRPFHRFLSRYVRYSTHLWAFLFVLSSLYGALFIVGFLGWFVALLLGRMPDGLRNLGAYVLRYGAQTSAYFYVLTERYPDAGPKPDAASP